MDPRDTAALLPPPPAADPVDHGFFDCAEESAHYAFSVQLLLTQYASVVPWQAEGVAELGSGDARAIGHVVRAVPGLRVHGTDISPTSVERARQTIAGLGVTDRYGVELVLRLLKAGFDHLLVALPSYSDPAATLATAADLGYQVANFLAMGLEFGAYSREPKVAEHIAAITADGHGWAGQDSYVVAVALLTRSPDLPRDRAPELLRALQLTP